MKKIGLFILTGLILFSSIGCGKKETAAEIMEKVDQKSAEVAQNSTGIELSMDGTVGVSMQGITIKPTFQIEVEMDHLTDLSNFKGSIQLIAEVMNEKFQMNGWIVDDMIYTDADGELDIEEFDLSQMMTQSSSFAKYFENEDTESFYKDFTVEKTKDGYILKKEQTDFSSLLGTIKMLAALGSDQDQDYLDALKSFNIRSMIITINVSKDYVLENQQIQFLMEFEIEGQKVELDLDMNISVDFYEDKRVEIPDLNRWYVGRQSVSCLIEQNESMSMAVEVSAEDDEIDRMVMKIAIDSSAWLEELDFSSLSNVEKNLIKEMFLEELGIDENTPGLSTSVDFTDVMVITLDIDLKKASREDLEKIG